MEVPPRVARSGRHYKILCALAVLLLGLAVPVYHEYSSQQTRIKESLLKKELHTLRTVIDNYTYDKKKAPQSLQDLVGGGYLREIPADPITGSNRTWRVVMEKAKPVKPAQPSIFDVLSLIHI